MELICEKYQEKVDSKDPVCRHAEDYCRTRTSCIIRYMEKEKQREQQKHIADENGGPEKPEG